MALKFVKSAAKTDGVHAQAPPTANTAGNKRVEVFMRGVFISNFDRFSDSQTQCLSQGPCGVHVCSQCFGDDAAHLNKAVHHAFVNFKVNGHTT